MQPLCAIEEIKPGSGHEVIISGEAGPQYVALFQSGSEVVAYANICPHQGRNLSFAPGEFLFGNDGRLICPHHGACFDLASGLCTDGPCKGDSLTPLPVIVRDGHVWLKDGVPRTAG